MAKSSKRKGRSGDAATRPAMAIVDIYQGMMQHPVNYVIMHARDADKINALSGGRRLACIKRAVSHDAMHIATTAVGVYRTYQADGCSDDEACEKAVEVKQRLEQGKMSEADCTRVMRGLAMLTEEL